MRRTKRRTVKRPTTRRATSRKTTRTKKVATRPGAKAWTPTEVSRLRTAYRTKTATEIAKTLRRSLSSVKSKARALGLTKPASAKKTRKPAPRKRTTARKAAPRRKTVSRRKATTRRKTTRRRC